MIESPCKTRERTVQKPARCRAASEAQETMSINEKIYDIQLGFHATSRGNHVQDVGGLSAPLEKQGCPTHAEDGANGLSGFHSTPGSC
eukprot:scaffold453_cov243-Pinguiococcus_pyrenoidosus.AAC.12